MAKKKNGRTSDIDINNSMDVQHMPEEDKMYFVNVANYIGKERERFKSTHTNETIVGIGQTFKFKDDGFGTFFAQAFGSVEHNFEPYYREYGKGNVKFGRRRVMKMIFSALKNNKNWALQENNLELYYRACEAGYDPDRTKIEKGILKVPKDDVIERASDDVADTLDTRTGDVLSRQEITQLLKEDLETKMRQNEEKEKKEEKNKKYRDGIQTELEFPE